MKYLTFNKEFNGRWYVDLPSWDGNKEDLEMVLSADTMLDIIAQGENKVEIAMSLNYLQTPTFELTIDKPEFEGRWYKLSSDFYNFDIWLCKVTKFVFGEFPEKLYIYG